MNFRYFWQDNSCCKDGDIRMSLLEIALTSFFYLIHIYSAALYFHFSVGLLMARYWTCHKDVDNLVPVAVGLFKDINTLLLWSLWYLYISHMTWVWICSWKIVPLNILTGSGLTQKVEDQTLDHHSNFIKVVTISEAYKEHLSSNPGSFSPLFWNKFSSMV